MHAEDSKLDPILLTDHLGERGRRFDLGSCPIFLPITADHGRFLCCCQGGRLIGRLHCGNHADFDFVLAERGEDIAERGVLGLSVVDLVHEPEVVDVGVVEVVGRIPELEGDVGMLLCRDDQLVFGTRGDWLPVDQEPAIELLCK